MTSSPTSAPATISWATHSLLRPRPELRVRLIGTAPFAQVHVIKDNKYVYSTQPGRR